jgi:hypothetical protein
MKRLTNAEKAELHKKLEEAEKAKFKPYENKIAELEKENAELRAKESFVGDQNRKLCEQQQKIEVLEAENAELEEKNKWYSEQVCNKECAEVWGQLTKAKEIIKNLMVFAEMDDREYEEEYKEAEQFLSEVEK